MKKHDEKIILIEKRKNGSQLLLPWNSRFALYNMYEIIPLSSLLDSDEIIKDNLELQRRLALVKKGLNW
tara:strand:+ start:767 stop:973 length:207 start_codon:yes stop_codon:yes gene_type:complete